MHSTNMDYHLRYLKKRGFITISSNGGYARYYAVKLDGNQAISIAGLLVKKFHNIRENPKRFLVWYKFGGIPKKIDRIVINLLREVVTHEILLYLMLKPNTSQIEISRHLKKHHSTVSFHLKKLIKIDIIETKRNGNEIRYEIKNPDELMELYRWAFALKPKIRADGYMDYKVQHVMLDSLVKGLFEEIFPLPFRA